MAHHDHESHEHEQHSKERAAHAPHEEHSSADKGPSSEDEINPNLASDIAYWSHELGVDGKKLHEAIRSHGTHVGKVRAALGK